MEYSISLTLQFHLLPIRDWNPNHAIALAGIATDCNFIYSLLGIETGDYGYDVICRQADCNFIYSLLGIETTKTLRAWEQPQIAISFTPY